MSDSKESESTPAKKPKAATKSSTGGSGSIGRGLSAIIAIAIALVIVGLVNYAANSVSVGADLTENKMYTLSKGTKNILENLETPVTLRYFVTDSSDVMTPREKALSRRIEDVLSTYASAAPAKEIEVVNEKSGALEKKKVKMISIEKLNPEPSTDAEDAARLEGLQQVQSPETGNQLYAGVVAQCIDSKEKIEVMTFGEERLEYELSRAISNVHGGKSKTIRVMSSVPVSGGMGGNFQAPPRPALAFYQQLEKDYNVETIPVSGDPIPDDTEVLVVVHPFDVTDEAEFAIDQFVLKGGKVIALVDPNFFYAETFGQPGQFPGMPAQGAPGPASHLNTLFKAWGVEYSSTEVLADFSFGTQLGGPGNFVPTLLSLPRNAMVSEAQAVVESLGPEAMAEIKSQVAAMKAAMDKRVAETGADTAEVKAMQAEIEQYETMLADVDNGDKDSVASKITVGINGLTMLTPGVFEFGKLAEGLTATALVQSSPNNQLVPSMEADPRQQEAMKALRDKFKPYEKRRAFVLQLGGLFKTAFPDGDPSAPKEEEKADDAEAKDGEKKADEPKEPAKPEALTSSQKPGTVVLVADVDFIFYEGFQQLGLRNQNLTLFQNTVEVISGDPNLVDVRSRENVGRRFTKPNEWMAEARSKYQAEIEEMSKKEQGVMRDLTELIQKRPDGTSEVVIGADMQEKFAKLEEDQIRFNKRVRELEKEVNREYKSKLASYKFGNAMFMPLLVIFVGICFAFARRLKTAAR